MSTTKGRAGSQAHPNTRSELINKAVIYYLNAIENPQNTNEKDIITIINNPETISQIAELVFQKIQNETFTLKKK